MKFATEVMQAPKGEPERKREIHIVYPDPPLGEIEESLLVKALKALSPLTRLATLGELS